MSSERFVKESCKKRVLESVTRYCCECYTEFELNSVIYYDTLEYRYICKECAKEYIEKEEELKAQIKEVEEGVLF